MMEKKENILQIWHQFSHFLNDLQSKCSNPKFVVLSAHISATLLDKLIRIPNFDDNEEVLTIMKLCLKCGCALADALPQTKKEAISVPRRVRMWHPIYAYSIDHFYALFKEVPIFLTDAFYPDTLKILKKSTSMHNIDTTRLRTYLDLVEYVSTELSMELVFQISNVTLKPDHFVQIMHHNLKNRDELRMVKILQKMLT